MSKSQKKNSSMKHILIISFLICIAKALGIIKQSVIAWAFGVNSVTDSFFAADGFISMIAQILSSAIIPIIVTEYIYVKKKNTGDLTKADKLINHCFIFFGIVGLILMGVSMGLSAPISNLIGISYPAEEKERLALFIIGLSPVICIAPINAVAQGKLNADNNYTPGRLLGVFYSVFIIAAVFFLKDSIGMYSLIAGFLSGYFFHTIFILFFVRKKISLKDWKFYKNKDFKRLIINFFPVLLSVSMVDIGQLIDKIISSSLAEGSVTTLSYSQVVSTDLVNSIVISVVGMVLLTSFSDKFTSSSNGEEIKNEFIKTSIFLNTFVCLITIVYFLCGNELVSVILKRGSFNDNNVIEVSNVVFLYVIGFMFMALNEIIVKIHYSMRDMKRPLIISTIGVLVNVGFSILFSSFMGVKGIALATSISMIVMSILLTLSLGFHIKMCPFNKMYVDNFIKMIVSAFISFTAVYMLKIDCFSGLAPILSLIICGTLIIFIYTMLCFCMKENTMCYLIQRLKKKKNNYLFSGGRNE